MKPVKTKSALRNRIYKIVAPLTKGIFNDSDWSNVRAVFSALEQAGVSVTIERADYRQGETHPTCKNWDLTIEAFGMKLSGHLVASFCGTVSDPTCRYDICFIV
jgi:hypothetical protein